MENIILRNYLDDLKNGLDVFYKEYERSIDPTSFLISKQKPINGMVKKLFLFQNQKT